jgi:arsenite-transporting ATPase
VAGVPRVPATKVPLVTLAKTIPVLEAAELQDDLERAGIHPRAWVVKFAVAAAAPISPLLRQRADAEIEQIKRVRDMLADRYAVVPLTAAEPVGVAALKAVVGPQRDYLPAR